MFGKIYANQNTINSFSKVIEKEDGSYCFIGHDNVTYIGKGKNKKLDNVRINFDNGFVIYDFSKNSIHCSLPVRNFTLDDGSFSSEEEKNNFKKLFDKVAQIVKMEEEFLKQVDEQCHVVDYRDSLKD